MKKINFLIFICILSLGCFVSPSNSYADYSKISEADAAKGIVGKWKLLSFTDAQGKTTSYENANKIWTFTGKSLSVESNDLGGRREGDYRLVRSIYRPFNNTINVLCKELEPTHLPYGKFIVISIENDVLTLSNWDNEIRYILKKVKE